MVVVVSGQQHHALTLWLHCAIVDHFGVAVFLDQVTRVSMAVGRMHCQWEHDIARASDVRETCKEGS